MRSPWEGTSPPCFVQQAAPFSASQSLRFSRRLARRTAPGRHQCIGLRNISTRFTRHITMAALPSCIEQSLTRLAAGFRRRRICSATRSQHSCGRSSERLERLRSRAGNRARVRTSCSPTCSISVSALSRKTSWTGARGPGRQITATRCCRPQHLPGETRSQESGDSSARTPCRSPINSISANRRSAGV